MKDIAVSATALNNTIRIHAVSTTCMVEQARQKQDLYPTSCAALGRVMSASAIMASTLKSEDDRYVVSINGHGPAGTILAQADGRGNVRGFIGDPHIDYFNEKTGKLDVGRAVGKDGYLRVMLDQGLKEPFTGTVDLVSGEIGDDFAAYFVKSEQTPTAVAVGVLVDTDYSVASAGGLLIQLMPDTPEEIIETVEKTVQNMKPISTMMKEMESVDQVVLSLFPDAEIMSHKDVQWNCGCSREHFLDSLAVLHEKDLEEMINEDHGAEIICQYCQTKYTFTEEELRSILEKRHTCGK